VNANRRALVLLATVVVVTLLIWAGVHNARNRRLDQQHAMETKAVLMPDTSDGASADDTGPVAKLQGTSAPAFKLVDLDGKTVSLADYKGKPVLVNFWATWCGPCKLEMPWFEEFSKKYAGQGLVILGVAADDASKTAIAGTAKRLGVDYPILLKDSKVEDAYGGVDYLPESFYVDRAGKILIETAGVTSEAHGKDEIEANIQRLLAMGRQ
jgi:thiol-disulfide isomerase/thioredoxin